MISDWEIDLQKSLKLAEEKERSLSYLSPCQSEEARKQSGSYYTPIDVATYFWEEFFSIKMGSSLHSAKHFLKESCFIEPAAGSGVLAFSLLQKLASLGCSAKELADIELHVIDINKQALGFIKEQFQWLSSRWGVKFSKICYVSSDFRKMVPINTQKPLVFFGNPPFVKNNRDFSSWKNLFADFVEIALNQSGDNGSIQYILPLSIAFSRDYKRLREMLIEHNRTIVLSNFDNIPDTLFKTGKPEHINTNKANSQRCSILTVCPAEKTKVFSTSLQRWSKQERDKILTQSPMYYDVTSYRFNDQIPRPENPQILEYLSQTDCSTKLGDWISAKGKYTLQIASVARNYIGIREGCTSNVCQLQFERKDDFYRILILLSSDLFFAYWKTVGDGFHVTKSSICDMPLSIALISILNEQISDAKKMWKAREKYKKTKLNSGNRVHSYDFSESAPPLLSMLFEVVDSSCKCGTTS